MADGNDKNLASRNLPYVEKDRYEGQGGPGRLLGFIYQLRVLMFFMLCGLKKKPKFRLATEMMAADKFDDLVLEYQNNAADDSERFYLFVQAKHRWERDEKEKKERKEEKISYTDLFSTGDSNKKDRGEIEKHSGDFYLKKYFDSYCKIKRHPGFSEGKLEAFVIYTNIDLDKENLKSKGLNVVLDTKCGEFLTIETKENKNRRYRFSSSGPSKVYENLASKACYLAQILVEKVLKQETLPNEGIFSEYRFALISKVINTRKEKLFDNFIEGEDLTGEAENFRDEFVRQVQIQSPETDGSKKPPQKIWDEMKDTSLKLSRTFRFSSKLKNIDKLCNEFTSLLESADANKEIKIGMLFGSPSRNQSECILTDIAPNIKLNIMALMEHVFTKGTRGKLTFQREFLDDVKQPDSIFKLKKYLTDKFNDLEKYQFEINDLEEKLRSMSKFPDSSDNDKEIPDFLDRLILAVKQPNESELGDILRREMGKDYKLDYLRADLFTESVEQRMRHWFLKEGGSWLSEENRLEFLNAAEMKIQTLALLGLSLAYREKLDNYGMYFREENQELMNYLTPRDTHERHTACNLVATEETLTAAIQVHQAVDSLKLSEKYECIIIRLHDLLLPGIRRPVIDAFRIKNQHNLLVVVSEQCSTRERQELKNLYKDLDGIMMKEINGMKKLVFVTRRKLDSENCYHIDCKLGFNNLIDESQKNLLNKQQVNLQDREENTSFAELLRMLPRENVDSNGFRNFKDAIDSTTLRKLISGRDDIKIGSSLQSLDQMEDYFVDREFLRRVIIKFDVLKSEQTSEVYAVGHADRSFSQILDMHAITERQKRRIKELKSGEERKQFDELCTKYSGNNVHWLMAQNGKLLWIESNGSFNFLLGYKDFENTYDCECRVCQTAASDAMVDKLLATIDKRPVIISDVAGMGKTTVLTHLTSRLKDIYPDMWVIRINLNDYTDALEKQSMQCNLEEDDKESMIDFFVNDFLELNTQMEKEILKHLMTVPGGVALLFDGVDEVSPEYTDTVLKMLEGFREYSGLKLVVTTRPHIEKKLESTLQTFSHSIKQFSRENQIDFLVRFWRNVCNEPDETLLKGRAEIVLEKMKYAKSDQLNDFAVIPLQTRMIAEIFVSKNGDSVSVVNQDNIGPDELDHIKLADLYRMFVHKKYEIYRREKKKEKLSNLAAQKDAEKLELDFLEAYRRLAMYMLLEEKTSGTWVTEEKTNSSIQYVDEEFGSWDKFHSSTLLREENSETWNLPSEEIDEAKKFIDEIKKGTERLGIVTNRINQIPRFIHRTFLEYFVASYLFQNLDKLNENGSTGPLGMFILNEILFRYSKYVRIRAFFNDLLTTPPIKSIFDARYSKEDLDRVIDCKYRENIFHVAAKEGNYEIMRSFFSRLLKNFPNPQEVIDLQIRGYRENLLQIVISKNPLSENDLAVVSWLLHQEADVNVTDCEGNTTMHIAIEKGHFRLLKLLVGQRDVDTTARNNMNETLQHVAAKRGNMKILKWLVNERGCSVDVRDKNKWTLQHLAAKCGNLNVLMWLVEDHRLDVNVRTRQNQTLQHIAARYGNLDTLKWLVKDQGCDVDVWDNLGTTLQHSATRQDDLDMLKWLVKDQGCDVDVRDYSGKTLQHVAAKCGTLDAIKWLVEDQHRDVYVRDNSGKTVQHFSAANHDLHILVWLVEDQGCDVDVRDYSGKTLQHVAAECGTLDTLKWLVEDQRRDVDVRDNSGKTLQHVATEAGDLDALQWLVKNRGCDVDVRDNSGNTVQHFAATNDDMSILVWLVEDLSCDVNVRDDSGKTLQHVAASNCNFYTLKYLAEVPVCDVDVRDDSGTTLQHVAVQYGNLDTLQYLVDEYDCDVNVQDKSGKTLQHVAVQYGNLDRLQYLVDKYDCDVNVQDKSGKTLQHVAAECGNFDVLKWLVEDQGCDVDVRDNSGKTVQQIATQKEDFKILNWLDVYRGRDVNARDNS